MSKKNIIPQLVGGAIAVTGIYMLYTYGKKNGWFKFSNPMEEEKKSGGSIADKTQPTNVTTPTKKDDSKATKESKYVVKLNSGVLNLRQTPSTKGKILTTYQNGEEIYARPSVVKGWSEVLDTTQFFPKVIGYVSSSYIVVK